jgi:hypothetical protein
MVPTLSSILPGMAFSRVIITQPFDTESSCYKIDLWVYRGSQIAWAVFINMIVICVLVRIAGPRDVHPDYFLAGQGGEDRLVVYAVALLVFKNLCNFGFVDGVLVTATLLILVLPHICGSDKAIHKLDCAEAKLMEIKTAIMIAIYYKVSRLRKSC